MSFVIQDLGCVPYKTAWDKQRELVKEIDEEKTPDQLLLLEHPHTITLGRRSNVDNLLFSAKEYKARGVDVVEIDRGGDVTYHGPGQLVGYPLFFLANKGPRQYIRDLEEMLISTLQQWSITAVLKEGYTGVWVGDQKIAAIGVKFNRGRTRKGNITSHGFALNVSTDLRYFKMIVPCGIQNFGVTSMEHLLGDKVDMRAVKESVAFEIQKLFK